MEDKDLSLLLPRILAGLCNQIGFGVAGVLQSKINRLVVELEHKAAVCRVRKSVLLARSQTRNHTERFKLQTVLFFFFLHRQIIFILLRFVF